jgi:hypothetical protein
VTSSTTRSALLLIAALALTALYFYLRPQAIPLNHVDAQVYTRAIDNFTTGQDPYQYNSITGLPFVYPPVFLYLGAALAHILTPHAGWLLYLTLHLLASLLIPWLLYRFYLPTPASPTVVYALFFAAPGFIGLLATQTGNIAVLFYALLLATAIPGLRRNQWLPFYLAVFLSASIKPGYLPFLLLPFLYSEEKNRRQPAWAILTGLLTTLGLLSQRWLTPTLYTRFTQTLAQRTTQAGDVGVSLYGITYHLLHSRHLPAQTPLAALAYTALLAITLTLLIRLRHHPHTPAWQSLVLIGVLFLNPRLEFYDLCIAFPIAFLLVTATLPTRSTVALYLALTLPALYLLLHHPDSVDNGGLGALAILTFWLLATLRLLRTPNCYPYPRSKSEEPTHP